MRKTMRTALIAALSTLLALATARAGSATPETVLITFHPKRGAEQALAEVIARHWAVARGLDLVLDTPHVTLRGTDGGGNAYFVEVLTWRDAAIPDSAPKPILDLWDQMNALVESRDARPGLDFRAMTVLSPQR
jgi:hypothetical protein